jgi:NADH-quinone oxidoreductase subunit L
VLLSSLVAVPLLAGAGLVVAGRRADRVAPAAGVLVAAAALALAIAAAVTRPAADAPLVAGIRAGLAVDGLSALMIVTVAGVTLAVLAYAAGEVELRTARFVGFMLLFAGAMLVTVTATTLAVLLMAWEVMGAMSWALVAYRWREPESVGAAHTAFLTTRLADVGLYVAAGAALAGGVGTLALAELPAARVPWLHVVVAGLVLAALGKSAQLPFSFWLSQAMRGPSPVSALLHSATMVAAGAYLLLRLAPGSERPRPCCWVLSPWRSPTSSSCSRPRPARRSGSWCSPPASVASPAERCSWWPTPPPRACSSSAPAHGSLCSGRNSSASCAVRPAGIPSSA